MKIYATAAVFIIAVMLMFFLTRISKRITAYIKIGKLKKMCGARVILNRPPLLSFFKLSKKPDMTVEIGNSIYLLRFINGIGSSRYVHFANKSFFVTFSKHILLPRFRMTGGRVNRNPSYSLTSLRRVWILPDAEIPEKYEKKHEFDERKVIPVLIFSPAPQEVTFVTETRTSIKLAFTGDEFYGNKIFTASTFVIYADRVKRQSEIPTEYLI